jgi:hypothetical protein
MAIRTTESKRHWNYFIALERDMEVLSRYVELCEDNFDVYSIELAHLLFASASEVDVVAKLLCHQIAPTAPRGNINDYRATLLAEMPDLPESKVVVARYGLTLRPWDNWRGAENPIWWKSYNNVKHERGDHFSEATLKNSLNAMGALLILIFHHYSRKLALAGEPVLSPKNTTYELNPRSTLFRLPDSYYYEEVVT